VYHRPLQVRKSSVVRAIAVHPDYQDSEVAAAGFVKITPMVPSEISLDMPASPKYPAQGAKTLADHKKGGADIHDGNWLGFEGTPAGLTMHFDKDIQPSNMTISALVATGSWIFPPQSIEVLGSLNGREFFPLGHMKYDAGASAPHPSDGQNFYTLPLLKQTVRHLKVVVHPYGQLPDWHPGAGKPAWLFLDEIIVE
jgi:hexosaminidase